jgi:hypothetical protein
LLVGAVLVAVPAQGGRDTLAGTTGAGAT